MHHVLFYEVTPDFAERRLAFRDPHLRAAWDAVDRGELVLGGAFGDTSDGAMLLFKGDAQVAERFARADPYVTQGLVQRWFVRRWSTVVGYDAMAPVHPASA
jgi:uncharacterized protein YciI